MRNGVLATALTLLVAALAGAQQAKHKPKPKKIGPEAIILKVIDRTGASDEESVTRSLFTRAGLLNIFSDKKIHSISPAEIQGTIDQLQIDFTKTANWTPDNLEKLADPWNVAYVAGATLDSVSVVPPAKKGGRANAGASVTIWLYDVKNHKFIDENDTAQSTYMSMKGEETADAKATEYEAIVQAAQMALKGAFKKKG